MGANGYIIEGNGIAAAPDSYPPSPPIPPIHYSGSDYVVAVQVQTNTGDGWLSVFKKIVPVPGAAPYFVELDAANRPVVNSGAAQSFYPDSGGNIISNSYANADAVALSIQEFDLDTETWGPVISAAGPTPSQAFKHRLIRRANGDWVILYDTTIGPETLDIYWTKYASGAWSAAVRVSTLSNGINDLAELLDIALNETTGDVAIYWYQVYFSEGYFPYHKYLTVLSGVDVLGTNYNVLNSNVTGGWETYGRPIYNSAQDQWEWPAILPADDFPTSNSVLGLIESSPSGNPTTTIFTRLVGGPDVSNVNFPRAFVDQPAQRLYFLWANNYVAGGVAPGQMLFISRPLNGSSGFPTVESDDGYGVNIWTPTGMLFDGSHSLLTTAAFRTILYDAATDTLNPTPTVTSGTAIDLPMFSVDSGTLRAFVNPLCAFQYYFSLTTAPLITLANPGPAGRKPAPLTPNQFDFCLHREFRVFQQIDYERLGCGRLPSCFRMDEREWGGWE